MSPDDPFFIKLDSNTTDSVDASIQPLEPHGNDLSIKTESGDFDVSAPPFKTGPLKKHPTITADEKENVYNGRPPFHQKTGAELAAPRYGKMFHHPNTTWSVKDTVILVRTAEARMSWGETMKLLPEKTEQAAKSKIGELRLEGKIAHNGNRLHKSDFTYHCPGLVYEILKEAADVQDAATFDKRAHLNTFLAAIDKTQLETDPVKAIAITKAVKPKRAYKKLDQTWSDEEDLYLLREWWHKRRNEKDIAQDMPTKNAKMCAARRVFLVHGNLKNGISYAHPVYDQVRAEKNYPK